jgi:5-methylcytosine-specific restriction endonuclease McrA
VRVNIGDILFKGRNTGHDTTDPILRYLVRYKYKDTCAICGRKYNPAINNAAYFSTIEIDHIIPYSHGGANHIRNYQLTCKECNRKKKDSIPDS